MERRKFVAAAGLTAASYSRVLGANSRVAMGLIGSGGRGRYVGGFMKQASNVEFIAVNDVYQKTAEAAKEWAGGKAQVFADFRRLLEVKEVDAVLVATPDHWHAIPTIHACEAGKHVYVEKPLAHNIAEGRAIVNAARRHNRTVLVGTQQRSATHFPEVARIIRSGELGQVRYVRVWNFSNMTPNGIGNEPPGPVPEGLDWDMYCGPAPVVPYRRARFQGSYRWFWDYAGGTITDFGTHRFDTVHQIMGVDAPHTISASGGRFSLNDCGEMPDVMQVTYEYPGFVMSYEACNMSAHGLGGRTPGMRYYNARGDMDRPHGMAFYGANGALFCDRIGYEIYPFQDRIERKTHNTTDATSLHAQHFIRCLRDGEKPKTDAETGHRSTNIAHLGNIAYKTGLKLKWDAAKESFTDAPAATKLLRRNARKPWDLV